MLARVRENLALVLLALLPFHALLVTVLTNLIAGPGHRPIAALALWKEGLLGCILIIALIEILRSGKPRLSASKKVLDAIDWTILLAFGYAVVQSLSSHPPLTSLLLGFKYDFVPLVAFVILRRVPWSERFRHAAMQLVLVVGGIVAAYGILTLFLPLEFFTHIGYSALHSLYLPDKALAAFQFIGDSLTRRVQSTMSGPNQLGLYMLLPLGVVLASGEKRKEERGKWKVLAGILLIVALVLTYSRAAWVGAAVMMIVAVFLHAPAKKRRMLAALMGAVVVIGIVIAIAAFPSIFLRAQSNEGHLQRPIAALQTMIAHPLGLGLGSAGPASNAVSDTCVELPAGSDASWAQADAELCVFVGGTQVQPATPCHCPLLTEDWYLQWGVEMGVVGLVLSLLLAFFVLRKWKVESGKWPILAFLGISIAGLFLHAFEDAAVAYTVWLMVASELHP